MSEDKLIVPGRRVTGHWWIENLLRPALIAGMAACLMAAVVTLLQFVLGDWDGTYLLVFAFVASLEGILSERALQKQRITGWAYFGSRAAELLILLLVLKVINYIPVGFDQLWADALTWGIDPSGIVNTLDLFTGLLFVPVWAISIYVGRMAIELDVEESTVAPPPDKTSVEYYMWLTQPSVVRDRQERLGWLAETFVWGGIGLLVAAALTHAFVVPAQTLAIPTLLYFALGIALLAQAQFSVSHAGWRTQGLQIQPGIARRWLRWAVVFLVGIALLASLLPTRYAMGPVSALLAGIGMLIRGLMYLIAIIFFLIAVLLSLLFPAMQQPETPPPAQEFFPPPAEALVGAESPAWLAILASISFWGIVIIIVGYALVRVIQDRLGQIEGEEGTEGTWWQRLLVWLRVWWRQLWAWQQGLQSSLASRLASRRDRTGHPKRGVHFFFPGRLSPREQVRYFYLSAAKRAAQAGQPRGASQTPYEYQADLDQEFPELEPDLEGLTEAFVDARYSPKPVEHEDVAEVKPLWQRIKAALRRRRVKD